MGWRWLKRMRTALYLLGALGLLTMLATAIPQEPNVPSTVQAWREGTEGPPVVFTALFDGLGFFDMYGSGLFLALLMLLFISLTACLLPRIKAWVRLVRTSRPPLAAKLGPQQDAVQFTTDRSVDEVHASADELLRGRRWRTRRHGGGLAEVGTSDASGNQVVDKDPVEVDPSNSVGSRAFESDEAAVARDAANTQAAGASARPVRGRPAQLAAEKGLWSREGGSLLFHLSFYVLLISIILGQLTTFEGQRGVVEGEPGFRDVALSYWGYSPGRWFGEDDHQGWRFELDQFHVDWVRDPTSSAAGQPTEFRSDVTITPDEGEPYQAEIDSNEPLDVDGMKVTQLDWGYAPRVVVEVDGEVVHDAFLNAAVSDGGAFRGAVKAPSADPQLGQEIFLYPFAPDGEDGLPQLTGAPWDDEPMLLFRQYRGDLQLGATQQTINELDTSLLESEGGAFLRLGQSVDVEGVTVSFPELRRWVGYQVSTRPQIPWLLFGSGLLVAGLVPALYAYRRRLWVHAVQQPGTGRTLVTVGGRAFQRPEAFEIEQAQIARELASLTGQDPGSIELVDDGPRAGPDRPMATPVGATDNGRATAASDPQPDETKAARR